MIIQTGLRTDIPAFYTPWFLRRLQEGYVLVRSPYNPTLVTRYRLSPEVVDCIGFCTKNPAPMLSHMDALAPYGQYWFVTITPYGRDIEPNVPPREQVMADFRRLSDAVGPACTAWRYDPILLTEAYTVERHLSEFASMCKALEGATHVCVISFIDLYAKVKRNFPEVRAVSREEQHLLAREMAAIAARHDIRIRACHEDNALTAYGVDCTGCMTLAVYETALQCRLNAPKQRAAVRGCACHLTCDIGAYNTCAHLCRYCYANHDAASVRRAMAEHDPASPLLTGHVQPGDRIHDARQERWRDGQISMLGENLHL
ncbi:MAG: DUF1848 domain-containing protein [Clostridia bacterium]|nr:DUF1848 domain-containing protein [Clostridia bacterium]